MNRKKIFFYITLALVFIAGAYQYRVKRFQRDISQDILRFHVLANSDSQADQSVKLKVRDEIGRYMKGNMGQVENLKECIKETEEKLPEITRIAEEVLKREGFSYPASARVGTVDFPEKQYGSYTFPGGSYKALQITLGEGEGHNWWCVMYPNMCFAGSVYEVVEEDAKRELKAVLTPEEYEELMAESQISVKFKYWEKLKEWWK
ncbi:MAG: stage II sporulation protein R [Lachnospiraceae bacterium]|jgi:stage II sporulation protein R|uniref:stage II sporulation protein R n=1 Tax=Roseburia sp. 1XD42-69 TaxID=2320088 RepID=UPI000EA31F1C|nr:stage II sporulation protein R [Roseburia sp. 1XD42-69]MCI8874955.1 stage II sporulation protein R [Lachnospiraceae bacterium]MCX4319093.1 stage II sporulation protein R [Lachnospiraceae bacterium]RKJ63018.1 stage II sporulation protein R [Roseburia sp. 1XD42-69]